MAVIETSLDDLKERNNEAHQHILDRLNDIEMRNISIIDKLDRNKANKWVEKVVIGILIVFIGGVAIGLVTVGGV